MTWLTDLILIVTEQQGGSQVKVPTLPVVSQFKSHSLFLGNVTATKADFLFIR